MNDFRRLNIWNESMDLAERIYSFTASFPKEETYGMTSQIRRSAISVPSNIAEGAGRNNPLEFRQFLGVASGSAAELETQLLLAKRFGYIQEEPLQECLDTIHRNMKMTHNLKEKLTKDSPKSISIKSR